MLEPLTGISGEVFFLDMQLLDPNRALLAYNRYAFTPTTTLVALLAYPPTRVSISSSSREDTMTLTNNRKLLHSPPPAEIGLPVVAGSLMPQTAEQIEHVRQKGAPSFMLNTAHLFDPAEREVEIARLSAVISDGLRISTRVIFHSPNDFQALASANQMSQTYSVTKTEVSRLGSETLAEVTARPLKNTGQNRLVVAGGETSAAVCDGLRVSGMRVWKEIQPGLPFCVSLNDPPRMLVLKSGSFGKPDFFERAIEHLRES